MTRLHVYLIRIIKAALLTAALTILATTFVLLRIMWAGGVGAEW